MKEALCIIIFFLVAISLNAKSTVFRRDSFVDYGGDIAELRRERALLVTKISYFETNKMSAFRTARPAPAKKNTKPAPKKAATKPKKQ